MNFLDSDEGITVVFLSALLAGGGMIMQGAMDGVEPVAIHMRDDAQIDKLPNSFEPLLRLQMEYQILQTYYDQIAERLREVHNNNNEARKVILAGGIAPHHSGIRYHDEIVVGSGLLGISGVFNQMTKTQVELDQDVLALTRLQHFHNEVEQNRFYFDIYNFGQDALQADENGTYEAWLATQIQVIGQGIEGMQNDPVMPDTFSKAFMDFQDRFEKFYERYASDLEMPAMVVNEQAVQDSESTDPLPQDSFIGPRAP